MSASRIAKTKLEELGNLIRYIPSERIPVSKIVFDKNNPNRMTQEQMAGLEQFMERIGFAVEVWLNRQKDGTYLLIDGEWRVRVLLKRRIEHVYAKVFNVPYSELRMMRQLANKIGGTHEKKKDLAEYKAIFEDKNLPTYTQMLGINIEDIQRQLEKEYNIFFAKSEEDVPPAPPKKPKTKTGEIYQIGKHRILCGDSTKPDDVSRLFDGKKAQLVVTDPPYGVDYAHTKEDYLSKLRNSKNTHKGIRVKIDIENDALEDYRDFFASFLKLIPFSDYNAFYIFMAGQELHNLRLAIKDTGLTWSDYLIWVKNRFVLGRKDYKARHEYVCYGWKKHHRWYGGNAADTILEFDNALVNDLHPTMKPVQLLSRLIQNSSKKGDIVYDPFLGSGSTVIAAEDSQRICYGIEKSEAYMDVIIARWEKRTGQKKQKL